MAVVAPDPGAVLPPVSVTKANLFLSCKNLPDMDVLSKTDAQITVTLKDARGTRIIGVTEVVPDTLSPKFATAIQFDYFFEEVQELMFEIYDIDSHRREYIGTVNCTVGDIFGALGQEYVRQIGLAKPKTKPSTIIVRGEEVQGQNAMVNFRLSANHLDKKDFGLFAKSDPYVMIHKTAPDGSLILVHRTETIMKTLDPTWAPFSIHISKLCNGDVNLPLVIQCFDWDKHSSDDYIGSFRTTLDALMKGKVFEFVDESKAKKKKSYRNSGVLNIDAISIVPEYSFLDYLAGGTQLNLMVAIDYTASNGNPATPGSLHYRDPKGIPNQYMQAMINVGHVLLPYDSDGNMPVYGFGGRLPNGETNHCFALTGDPVHPEAHGIPALLDLYSRSFTWVQLHGPTNFAPIIRQASTIAAGYHSTNQDISAYLLLLIITDGEITDLDKTIDAIIDASDLPLSIVIVGVGNADFSKMDLLDGDDGLLRSRGGKRARRDIVQFVPYNRHARDPTRLAAETLGEIPGQFLGYMKQHGIKPAPRLQVDINTLLQQVEITTTITNAGLTPAPVAAPHP